jgi:hypothetical protein
VALTRGNTVGLSGVRITKDQLPTLIAAVRHLADRKTMVGIPKVANARTDDADAPKQFNNAEIGYVQEHGSQDGRIPARPHLLPAIREHLPEVRSALRGAGKAALSLKGVGGVDAAYERLGLRAVSWVRAKIRSNVPPPLAARTVAGRIARRKSKTWKRKRRALVQANVDAGLSPGEGIFTALIDTGDYLAHITYVVRSRRSGRDLTVGQFKGK